MLTAETRRRGGKRGIYRRDAETPRKAERKMGAVDGSGRVFPVER